MYNRCTLGVHTVYRRLYALVLNTVRYIYPTVLLWGYSDATVATIIPCCGDLYYMSGSAAAKQ